MKAHKKFFLTTIIGIVLIGILIAIPTGYEDALIYKGTERAVAQVIEVDNSMIKNSGLINSGEQMCVLKVEDGAYKGEEIEGVNFLSGSLEKDKIFQVGDKALITISEVDGEIASVIMSDHYRLGKECILLVLFAIFLVLFAGKNGLQAIYSFVITILMIWKLLVPAYLNGYNPVWIGMAITVCLTGIIILFVYE